MIRSAIIAPDSDIRYQLEELVAPMRRIYFVRRWDRHPSTLELTGFLRATAIQLVFVSVEQMDRVATVIEHVAIHAPTVRFVAVGRDCELETIRRLARLGVRELLTLPATPESAQEALTPMLDALEAEETPAPATPLYTFLPCKPGVGASVTALQVSKAMSQEPERSVLLADFDLNNGTIGAMLGMNDRHTVLDAAARAAEMDETIWPKLVASIGNLDVLPGGYTDPSVRIEIPLFRHLLEFARRMYKTVVIDLSGNLEEFSIEAMRESTQIVMVMGAEVTSIHLARQKLRFLQRLEVDSRVKIVFNEAQNPAGMEVAEVERLLSAKIALSLPSDPASIRSAMELGKWVPAASALGKRYAELAQALDGRSMKKAEVKKPLRGALSLVKGIVGVTS